MSNPLRIGVLGCAAIARPFIRDVAASPLVRVVAVASRSADKAAAFAAETGVARHHGSYEALLADREVDAIYLPLPNSLHAEWAMAAARAGKHVLCEKPLAVSRAEALTMFEAARAHHVWLMEAFMYRFHPRTQKLAELLAQRAIGQVRLIRASFGFFLSAPNDVRLNADLVGGALMDVGCYCVNLARMVAGDAPTHASAAAVWAASGVDETLAGTLTFPGGVLAQIACTLAGSFHQQIQIIGSDGSIDIDGAFNLPADQPGHMRIRYGARAERTEELTFAPVDQYQLEAEALSQLVQAGHGATKLPEMPLAETLDNMATIEALLRSARTGQSVEIAP